MNPTAKDALPAMHGERTSADATFSKIGWRLLPLLLVSYMVAYLDRVNIGYAQLQMKQTLPWGDAVYGLGAGVFFIGYFLFEVPSNMLLERIGARKTLLRIMVCWGLVAAAMAFVETPTQFYVARFMLGIFEAGFFPGIILYLTYWYPSARRGQVIATFMSATTIISVLAGPVCGLMLKYMHGVGGWHGWQWMFMLQGLPAVLLGLLVFALLQDRPDDAGWLSASEKSLVRETLHRDRSAIEAAHGASSRRLLRDPQVWLLALVYFFLLGATYTMVFWLPTLIQSWGVKDLLSIGLLAAVPNACGVAGMILLGRNSDRLRERRWHFAGSVALAAAGLAVTALLTGHLSGSLLALCFATIGISAATPIFFALVSEYLTPATAAVGIALISSLGNLGPAISPWINGLIAQRTGSTAYSMILVIALYVTAGALLLLGLKAKKAPPRAAAMPA
ncbi:MFS transporter [Piscinibacter sp.]|uniref:MFS transporter n=1 Tax=Piscinibacter sp. TaxID=1903157 RepID=UPI002B826991|nr:MFS transporter [Albitalea sp.]HUG25467.1 MFS transporter [Albitalea sp.]